MGNKERIAFDFRVILGILVIVAGGILLLESLGIMEFEIDVWDYWPLILVAIGLGKLFQPRQCRHVGGGLFLLVLGVLFQLNNLDMINFQFRDIWPVVLIFIGFAILKRGFWGRMHHPPWSEKEGDRGKCFPPHPPMNKSRSMDNDFLDISAIMGGGEYVISSKQLKGGRISVLMGGCELDLRGADFTEDSIFFDISVIFGGVDIRVPSEWEVVLRGSPILGGIDNKTVPLKDATKKIIIKGSVIMGGIDIKN